ncbi:flagellar hook-associated protein FlgL [Colwelliaceae bacterium 6471]
MRIGTSNFYQRNLFELQQQQSDLDRAQQELSTGKKLIHPSDDPVAMTSSLIVKRDIEVADRYLKAQDTARRFQTHEESALSSMTSAIFRLQELVISAQNGALEQTSLNAISIEVQEIRKELVGLGNSKNASGETLFSGYQTDTIPFQADSFGQQQYMADDGRRELFVGAGFLVPVNDPGSSFLTNVTAQLTPFIPTAGGANSAAELSTGFVTDPDEFVSDTYTINFFDNAGTPSVEVRDSGGAVVPLEADSALNRPYIAGDDITFNGITVRTSSNPAPVNGDTFTMTPQAQGETSFYWALDQIVEALAVSGGKFTATANAANTGAAGLIGGEIVDVDNFVMDDYTVNILAPGQLEVRDSANNIVLPSTTYVDGDEFEFNGIQFSISGAANAGDSFNIDRPDNDRRSNLLSSLQIELANALENIDNTRATVGTRLNIIDNEEQVQFSFKEILAKNLSAFEDVDIYEAITNLELASTGLQAAQQSFARIQNLSLFNYI